jgi:hypothetical protein
MPRELLPLRRKWEGKGKAQLFPRTETRIVCGPPRDKMMRRPTAVDRHVTKRKLREIAAMPEPDYVHD